MFTSRRVIFWTNSEAKSTRRWVRDLREILEDDSGWFERNVDVSRLVLDPVKDLLDVLALHVELVAVPHGGLQENSNGIRERVYKSQGQVSLKTGSLHDGGGHLLSL